MISLKSDFKRASIVLLGEALPAGPGAARFRVIRAWKGELNAVVTLDADQFQRGFEPGQTVLVFAYERGGPPYLHDCSHTNPATADFVKTEIRTLDARSRWWKCPLSSLGLRRRPAAP